MQLQLAIDVPPVAANRVGDLAVPSGGILSGHADFWNTWDQVELDNEVAHWLRLDTSCRISGRM